MTKNPARLVAGDSTKRIQGPETPHGSGSDSGDVKVATTATTLLVDESTERSSFVARYHLHSHFEDPGTPSTNSQHDSAVDIPCHATSCAGSSPSSSDEDSGYSSGSHWRDSTSTTSSLDDTVIDIGEHLRASQESVWRSERPEHHDGIVCSPRGYEYIGECFSTPAEYFEPLSPVAEGPSIQSPLFPADLKSVLDLEKATDGEVEPLGYHFPPCSEIDTKRGSIRASARAAMKCFKDLPRRVRSFRRRRAERTQYNACPLCPRDLPVAATDLVSHIGEHVERLQSKRRCGKCFLEFAHDLDYQYHLAITSHGAVSFPSHQPRKIRRGLGSGAVDATRMTTRPDFHYRILQWEQNQLRRFNSFCKRVGKTSSNADDAERWTLGASDSSCQLDDRSRSANPAWDHLPPMTTSYSAPNTLGCDRKWASQLLPTRELSVSLVDRSCPSNDAQWSMDVPYSGECTEWSHDLPSFDMIATTSDFDMPFGDETHDTGFYRPPTPPASLGTIDDEPMVDVTRHSAANYDYGYLTPASVALPTNCMDVELQSSLSISSGWESDFASADPALMLPVQQSFTPSMSPCSTIAPDISMLGLILPKNVTALIVPIRTPPESPPNISRSLPATVSPPERLLTPLSQVMLPDEAGVPDDATLAFVEPATGVRRAGFATEHERSATSSDRPCKKRRLEITDELIRATVQDTPKPSHQDLKQIVGSPMENNTIPIDSHTVATRHDLITVNYARPVSNGLNETRDNDTKIETTRERANEITSSPHLAPSPGKPVPERLDTWISDQVQLGPSSFGADAVETRADTPSSVPNTLSDWTSNSTPCRPLADRILEYFNPEEPHPTAEQTAEDGTSDHADAKLDDIFALLRIRGPVTTTLVARLARNAIRETDIGIDEDVFISWLSEVMSDHEAFDANNFKEAVHALYDGIREESDIILVFETFVADFDPREEDFDRAFSVSGHSTATSAIHSLVSSTKAVGQDTPPSGGPGTQSQSTDSRGSGKGKTQQNNKRDAPEDDDADEDALPNKNALVDPGDGGPPQRGREQLPCVFQDLCCGRDQYISDLLRKLDTHALKQEHSAKFICGDCYCTFETHPEKISHSQQGCERHCVFPDCPENQRVAVNASSVLQLRHRVGPQCPSNKGRKKHRWRFIYALCRPQCELVPDPQITSGAGAEHAAPGATQSRPARIPTQQTSQKLVRCERLLTDAQRENSHLKEENIRLKDENKQLHSDKKLMEERNGQLRDIVQLCLEQGNSVITPAVRAMIRRQCPDLDTSFHSEPKQVDTPQQIRNGSAYPNTPNSNMAGAARSSRMPQAFEAGLPLSDSQPVAQNAQMSVANAMYSPSSMNQFTIDGYPSDASDLIYNQQGNYYMSMEDNNNMQWQNGNGS